MINELCWLHSRLAKDEILRIVMTRDKWEIQCSKSDLVTIAGDNCFRIVRPNGRIVSINPDNVALACISERGAFQ